jgi:hypothetical protein
MWSETIKKLAIPVVLGLLVLGCASSSIEVEPKGTTPEEFMQERSQQTQEQMMQRNRPVRVGPGRR